MSVPAPLSSVGFFECDPPRYASYPTVAQFKNAISAVEKDLWISALPKGATLSLHVNIPYCERLCWFCSCRTQALRCESSVRSFISGLCAEVDRLAARLTAGAVITEIHWTGGSPTVLPPALIRRLDGHLRSRLALAPDPLVSVAIEPHGAAPQTIGAFLECGMTVANVGLQDFDVRVQTAIGREQRPERVAATFAMLRAYGVHTIVADLLYGLPEQTVDTLGATARQLADLGPDRVTLTGYAHVPWMAKRQRMIPAADLPDARARAAQFMAAAAVLNSAGYVGCGIDHFALPQDAIIMARDRLLMRRDLLGFVDRAADAVIGMGPASISRFSQGYVQNTPETGAYLGRIAAGAGTGARGVALSLEDRLRGRAIEMLLCDARIDLKRLHGEFGDFILLLQASFEEAGRRFRGVVELCDESLSVRADGPVAVRKVAQLFDAYAEPVVRGPAH